MRGVAAVGVVVGRGVSVVFRARFRGRNVTVVVVVVVRFAGIFRFCVVVVVCALSVLSTAVWLVDLVVACVLVDVER